MIITSVITIIQAPSKDSSLHCTLLYSVNIAWLRPKSITPVSP